MDEIDRAIIRALRSDGRMPNAALAEAVGLSPSACLRRLRLLERQGTIRGYTVVVEEPAARDTVTVIVQITLERQTDEHLRRFEDAVRKCPEVRECHLMTGMSDYLLRVEARDAADYERIHKHPVELRDPHGDPQLTPGQRKTVAPYPSLRETARNAGRRR
jgi:DNA-binding Lrp family transcriptional regulator